MVTVSQSRFQSRWIQHLDLVVVQVMMVNCSARKPNPRKSQTKDGTETWTQTKVLQSSGKPRGRGFNHQTKTIRVPPSFLKIKERKKKETPKTRPGPRSRERVWSTNVRRFHKPLVHRIAFLGQLWLQVVGSCLCSSRFTPEFFMAGVQYGSTRDIQITTKAFRLFE